MLNHPGCQWAWNHLMVKGYCAYKITSAFTHPTFWDLMVLLAWAKCNPTSRKVCSHFGQFLWPKIMFISGAILDRLAYSRACQPLEQLPLLKTKKGRRKIVPWINKIVLLRKMAKVRRHRKNAATSHDDLVPCNAQIVMAEEFLCASLYAKKNKGSISGLLSFLSPLGPLKLWHWDSCFNCFLLSSWSPRSSRISTKSKYETCPQKWSWSTDPCTVSHKQVNQNPRVFRNKSPLPQFECYQHAPSKILFPSRFAVECAAGSWIKSFWEWRVLHCQPQDLRKKTTDPQKLLYSSHTPFNLPIRPGGYKPGWPWLFSP